MINVSKRKSEMDEAIPIPTVQTPCITLLAFDGLLQVLCEVSGDGHSEVGSGFSQSGSTEIKQREISKWENQVFCRDD